MDKKRKIHKRSPTMKLVKKNELKWRSIEFEDPNKENQRNSCIDPRIIRNIRLEIDIGCIVLNNQLDLTSKIDFLFDMIIKANSQNNYGKILFTFINNFTKKILIRFFEDNLELFEKKLLTKKILVSKFIFKELITNLIWLAVEFNYSLKMVEVLSPHLNKSILKKTDFCNLSLLHVSVIYSSYPNVSINDVKKIIKILLKRDADPNLQDNYGKIPLHHVIELDLDNDIIQLFFYYGSDLRIKDHNERTPFDYIRHQIDITEVN